MSDVLYLKIVSDIKQKILKGEYLPGNMLESETALMRTYETTKITIRKSLALLTSEGFIYSIPGKGNFVCKPETNLYTLSFNKFDKLNVQIDEVQLLSVRVLNVTDIPGIYVKLQITEEEMVIEIRRLLCSMEKVIAFEKIYAKYIPQNPNVENMLKFANYIQPLEDENAFVMEKRMTIEAIHPEKEIADQLKLPQDGIVYKIEESVKNIDSKEIMSYSIFQVQTKYLKLTAVQSFENSPKSSI